MSSVLLRSMKVGGISSILRRPFHLKGVDACESIFVVLERFKSIQKFRYNHRVEDFDFPPGAAFGLLPEVIECKHDGHRGCNS